MGRKKNNPELVEELIENKWNFDYPDWEEKYNSLSSSDMAKVGAAIDSMEDELINGDDDYDDDSGEGLSVYDAAQIWASYGKDSDYTFGYSEEDLEEAL